MDMPPTNEPARPSTAEPVAIEVARALHDAKCDDVVVIDARGLSRVTDYIVLASGTSDRQMRTAAEEARECAESMGQHVFGDDCRTGGTWFVVDLVDVVAHVFEPNTRAHYDLEMLWGEGPRLPWRRDGDANDDTAANDANGDDA